MANIIKIKEEANKLYLDETIKPIVCGNTNYAIQFEFDEDWAKVEKKTAVIEILGKKIILEFMGDTLKLPAMPNASYFLISLICSPDEDETYSTPSKMIYMEQNELGLEVQVMDPFVGYYSKLLNIINRCENGEIKVCSANNAEIATSATHAETATTATSATHAETATTATNATHAETATLATNATHAETATTATSATTANSSVSSNFAQTAHTSETQVSLTGDETISGIKNFTGSLKKANENVVSVKEIANPNILLNGDFLINQRDEETYSGENIYSVDRWKLGNSLATAAKNDNDKWYFKISGASQAESRTIFSQSVENFGSFLGESVTATLKFNNLVEDAVGTTIFSIFDGENTTSKVLSISNGKAIVTHLVSDNATKLEVIVSTTASGINCSLVPIWCKLEMGENSTMFTPRNPAEELWLCQRYYQKLRLDSQAGNATGPLVFQPVLVLNNTMRAKPTIKMIKYPLVLGNGYTYSAANHVFKSMEYNHLIITFTVSKNGDNTLPSLTTNDTYALRNGNATLDAEIY